jgi:hypothetical protein
MVDVRMRQNHRIDLLKWDRELEVLFRRLGAAPLEHPAIEKHSAPADPQHVAGTRNLSRSADELDFQKAAPTAKESFKRPTWD